MEVLVSSLLPRVGELGFRARQHDSTQFAPLTVLLAALIFILVGAGAGIIHASYAGIEERDMSRAPFRIEEENPSFLYRQVHDMMVYSPYDASLVYIWPLDSDAPIPPGLTTWPEPGHVVLSPRLAEMDAREKIFERYGEVVGTIDESGLATSTELLAYIVPKTMPDTVATNVMYPNNGFGNADVDAGFLGQAADIEPLHLTLVAYFITIGIGATIFGSVVIYQGKERWQKQSLILYSLGYSSKMRLRWMAGQLWRPFATGAGIGFLLLIPLFLTNIKLPGRDFTIWKRDVSSYWYLILLYALIPLVIYGFFLTRTATRVPVTISTNRPQVADREYSPVRAATCFFSVPIAVVLIVVFHRTADTYVFFIYLAVLLLVFATLIDLIGWAMVRISRRVRTLGDINKNVGAIIGSAGIQHRIRPVAILAVAIAATIIVGAQIQSYLVAWSQSSREWTTVYDQFDGEVLEVSPLPGADLSQLDSIVDRINPVANNYSLVLIETDCSRDDCPVTVAFAGESADLEDLRELNPAYYFHLFADTEPAISDFETMTSQAMENPENWDLQYQISIVASEPGSLDATSIKQIIAEESTPMWRSGSPASLEYYGSFQGAQTASWVGWMAVIGLAIVLWAIVLSLLSDLRTTIRRLAPLTVFANSEGVVRSVSFIRVSVPIVLGVGIGTAVGLMLCAALTLSFKSSLTPVIPFFIACLTVTGLIVALGILYSFIQAHRLLSTWKVGRW